MWTRISPRSWLCLVSAIALVVFLSGQRSVAKSPEMTSARELTDVLGRGLGITVDVSRTQQVREALLWEGGSTTPVERAKVYIAVRYELPKASIGLVGDITKKACQSDIIIDDLVSFGREMALIKRLNPEYNTTALSNLAFAFRRESSGFRFGYEDFRIVREFAGNDQSEVGTLIGFVAASRAERFSTSGVVAVLRALHQ